LGEIRNRSGERYKPSTLRGYRQALEERVLPLVGGARLSDITTTDLQALVDLWQGERQPASTIRNAIKPLQAIYRRAKSRGGLPVNPTQDLELPAPRPREVEIVAPDLAGKLLKALQAEERPVWGAALYAGLRYGELRAMRWHSLNIAGGTIDVRESWDPKEGTIDPKTRTSRRVVPIPGVLRDLLLDHRMRNGDPDPDALVFGRPDGKPFDAATLYRRADRVWCQAELQRLGEAELYALAGDAGVDDSAEETREAIIATILRHPEFGKPSKALRLHQARHTYASFMIAAGVNAKALSAYMGHSSIKVTFDLYGHLMPGNLEEAADLLDAYLDRANTQARLAALE
jgi:integrase